MTATDFGFQEAGEPQLVDSEAGGAPPPDYPVPGGQAPSVLQEPIAVGWTGEEAELFLASLWNVGAFFYGMEWMARQGEMAAFREDVAAELDLILPKSIGGPVGHAVHAVKIAGGLGQMAVARRELIKAGPRKLSEVLGREPAAAADAPAPAPANPGDLGGASGGLIFDENAAAVLAAQQATENPYAGLGMEDAA